LIEPEIYGDDIIDGQSGLPPHGQVARLLATPEALPVDFVPALIEVMHVDSPAPDSLGGSDDAFAEEDSVDLRTVLLPLLRRLVAWIGMHSIRSIRAPPSAREIEILRMMNVLDETQEADEANPRGAGPAPAGAAAGVEATGSGTSEPSSGAGTASLLEVARGRTHDHFGRPLGRQLMDRCMGLVAAGGADRQHPLFGGPGGDTALPADAPEA